MTTPGTASPQVTSGAPEVPGVWREPMAIFDRVKGIPRPPSVSGPQDWDRPTRDIYPEAGVSPGSPIPAAPYIPNIPTTPTWPLEEVRKQYPDAVQAITKMLEQKRKTISPEQAAGTFWKQFDEASQGSAAQVFSTILALLQGGQSAQPLQLSEMQTQWVAWSIRSGLRRARRIAGTQPQSPADNAVTKFLLCLVGHS